MEQRKRNLQLEWDLLGILLTPSWLSGIISAVAGIAVAVVPITLSHYRGSGVEFEYLQYHSGQSSFSAVSHGLLSNSVVANLPLIIFWALLGLVVYQFAMSTFRAIQNAAEVTAQLTYVHASRSKLMALALTHLLIRLGVAVLWLPYILVFFHQLLPYCISAALAGSAEISTVNGPLYIGLAVVVMTAAVHLHVVLLRLLLLKPRLFTSNLYVSQH